MRLCLDTTAYINFRRGKRSAIDLIDQAEWVGLPATVIGELEAGFRRGTRYQANSLELSQFISHRIVEILEITKHVSEIYGELVQDLTQRDEHLPPNVIWISATVARSGSSLLTYDEIFRKIPRIGLILL